MRDMADEPMQTGEPHAPAETMTSTPVSLSAVYAQTNPHQPASRTASISAAPSIASSSSSSIFATQQHMTHAAPAAVAETRIPNTVLTHANSRDDESISNSSAVASTPSRPNLRSPETDSYHEDEAALTAMRVLRQPVPRLSTQQLAGAPPLSARSPSSIGISTDSSQISPLENPKTPTDAAESHMAASPTSPLSQRPSKMNESGQNIRRSIDEFGFYRDSTDATPPHTLSSVQRRRHVERESEWLTILDDWQTSITRKRKRIKKMCRMGIPDSMRARAWTSLAGVDRIYEPGKFNMLVQSHDRPSIFDVIERDVHRCYPNHVMFSTQDGEGQRNLRMVLRAYALYDPKTGYCQGMGMLAGLLLMRMSPEESFWLLAAILKYYIPGYHSETLHELRVDAFAFELALQRHQRPLARHLIKLDVSPFTYLTQWFLTLYTMSLPWRSVLRVWDMFLCDGPKSLFRVAMAILTMKKNVLMRHCPTSSDVVAMLLEAPHEFGDPDALLNASLKIRIKRDEVERYRQRAKVLHASLADNLDQTNT